MNTGIRLRPRNQESRTHKSLRRPRQVTGDVMQARSSETDRAAERRGERGLLKINEKKCARRALCERMFVELSDTPEWCSNRPPQAHTRAHARQRRREDVAAAFVTLMKVDK